MSKLSESPPLYNCHVCKEPYQENARFCSQCGVPLKDLKSLFETPLPLTANQKEKQTPDIEEDKSFTPFYIGSFKILKALGKGGMGEVFLAFDITCGRFVALKRIRAELAQHKNLYKRFLREARITSQLSHPSIIPIYNLKQEKKFIYYTMPHVEGETLKDILKQARLKKDTAPKEELSLFSIPSLVRIFIPLCQAIAYAHSKNILHRDIKPENVIIGKYGQVLILDWGLALFTDEGEGKEEPIQSIEKENIHVTLPGKVVGTVAYMSPERALGQRANKQTDIYSLGVILYQILTLHFPFKRESLEEFRKSMKQEQYTEPSELAPYREVPKALAHVAKKCLDPEPKNRYPSIEYLIHDLENYVEGRAEWFPVSSLDTTCKKHWEFQENILIPEHLAITQKPEVTDWVNLMLSKESFSANLRIETSITLSKDSHGIGFLLSVPEINARNFLSEGYCLWLGTQNNRSSKLFRSGMEVLNASEIYLDLQKKYHIRIEKVDHKIAFYLNDSLLFTYISHIPLVGTHIGLLCRDAEYAIDKISVSVRSLSIKVNCLKVPDSLLASKNYQQALNEYRRISHSFPGRTEGREAMFRAGITVLEQSKMVPSQKEKERLLQESLDEFGKMHKTPGAPLEFLGKSLTYQQMKDNEEESKCLELALRRYKKHPLIAILEEQVLYRMYESSHYERLATYRFALITLQYLNLDKNSSSHQLICRLCTNWEKIFSHENDWDDYKQSPQKKLRLIIELAFRLSKPHTLSEILDCLIKNPQIDPDTIEDCIFYLIELGSYQIAHNHMLSFLFKTQKPEKERLRTRFSLLESLIVSHRESLINGIQTFFSRCPEKLHNRAMRILFHLMEQALKNKQENLFHLIFNHLIHYKLPKEDQKKLNYYRIWALLLEKNWKSVGQLFHQYPLQEINQDHSILHFLYGCWVAATEESELAMIHFSGVADTSHPRSFNLASHFLTGKLTRKKDWFSQAFLWEKRALYQQLHLYYHCIEDMEQAQFYQHLESEQYVNLSD